MSGFYANWFKVNHPNESNEITPMESGGFQTPFYFGGSQVPVNLDPELHKIEGNGYTKTSVMPELKGKGVAPVFHHKQTNIHIPRQLKF